ncbi:MAG TPA: hypothetical protein VGM98_26125 [Schlesneria sp.]|jgi:hypothetical protein
MLKLEKIMFCKSLRASSHVIAVNIAHRFASSIALIDAHDHAINIIKNIMRTMRIVFSEGVPDDDVEHVIEHLSQHSNIIVTLIMISNKRLFSRHFIAPGLMQLDQAVDAFHFAHDL